MSSVSDFKVGHGIRWGSKHGKLERYQYGLVIGTDERNLQVMPVLKLRASTKCYDEGGADPKADRDNVRLRHCSSERGPFSDLCEASERGGCYVHAVPSKVLSVGNAFIRLNHVEADELAHKDDVKDVIDHLWRDERQAGSVPAVQNGADGTGRRVLSGRRLSDDIPEPEEGLEAVGGFMPGEKALRLEAVRRQRARQDARTTRAAPQPDGEPSVKSRLAALTAGIKAPNTGHGGLGS